MRQYEGCGRSSDSLDWNARYARLICCITSRHVTLCHVALCHTASHRIALYVASRRIALRYIAHGGVVDEIGVH
jgi:hypothetical protein